jgi:hypothetical protein
MTVKSFIVAAFGGIKIGIKTGLLNFVSMMAIKSFVVDAFCGIEI